MRRKTEGLERGGRWRTGKRKALLWKTFSDDLQPADACDKMFCGDDFIGPEAAGKAPGDFSRRQSARNAGRARRYGGFGRLAGRREPEILISMKIAEGIYESIFLYTWL